MELSRLGTGDVYESQPEWLRPTSAGDGSTTEYPINTSLYPKSKVRQIKYMAIVMAAGSTPAYLTFTVLVQCSQIQTNKH